MTRSPHHRIDRLLTFPGLAMLALLSLLAPLARAAEAPVETALWTGGEGGYHSYRIPSLLALPQGIVLAFCEARSKSLSDAGDIDLVMRRSTDGGLTWNASRVIWDDGDNTCGNPCPVYDESTGKVVMLMTHNPGEIDEAKIVQGIGQRTAWVMTSEDLGETWSTPVDITAQVKRADWTWYATGPGVSIQLRQGAHAGRLVAPCDFNLAADHVRPFSHAIFSDDHGATWHIGGVTEEGANECQVVERNGGELLLNMRRGKSKVVTHRLTATSSDGGESWSPLVQDPALPEPECQASLIRMEPPKAEAGGEDRLLFSNPADIKKRVNMTVRLSDDGGRTWKHSAVLHAGPAAYSCLAPLSPTRAACLYEGGPKNPYQEIRFASFGLDWLAEAEK